MPKRKDRRSSRTQRPRVEHDGFGVSVKIAELSLVLVVGWSMSACTTLDVKPFPQALRPPKELAKKPDSRLGGPETSSDEPSFAPTPDVAIGRTEVEGVRDTLGADLKGDPIQVSFRDVPLIAFINEVFGEVLGLSYAVSPGLDKKEDLVTLRLGEPVSPSQLFATARLVLENYGIDVRDEDGVLSFLETPEISARDIPLLISGRALPEVPATHRTIFQLVPLRVVDAAVVATTLQDVFNGQDLKIDPHRDRNTLLLRGNLDLIALALEMVEVLDQPLMQGQHGLIIEPRFLEVEAMAQSLSHVLQSEGYSISLHTRGGAAILVPLQGANKLVAFAADQSTLEHIQEWARILDTQRQDEIEDGVFTYEVRNTQAEHITETLNRMLGSGPVSVGATGQSAAAEGQSAARGGTAGRLVVDERRNLLLFRGSGKEWAEILDVVAMLDKPAPSVLIEVLVAEITLRDQDGSGFEFLLRRNLGDLDFLGDDFNIVGQTLGRLNVTGTNNSIVGGGASLVLNSAGAARAALNFFYMDRRVSIRSSPKLVVKSGETASIQVGDEIPVISQRSEKDTQTEGTTDIVQEISYRKTGITLEIEPIVQANGLVDLKISQQLSEARPLAEGQNRKEPDILNREISTSLTLRDGGSLLMGGLISETQSDNQRGVPGIAKLPVLGRLFRSDNLDVDRTELIILVIPYVIADHAEGWELTKRMKEQLELHKEYIEKSQAAEPQP